MYLIIIEREYGAIDTDDDLYYGYYIIKFSSFPFTLQADWSIELQVVLSSETVCKGTYLFPININSHCYF